MGVHSALFFTLRRATAVPQPPYPKKRQYVRMRILCNSFSDLRVRVRVNVRVRIRVMSGNEN